MADCYADANPEEFVTVVGVGPMTLRTAVKGYVAAREKAAGTAGVLLTVVAQEAGKEPASFDPNDLDGLAEMEGFR